MVDSGAQHLKVEVLFSQQLLQLDSLMKKCCYHLASQKTLVNKIWHWNIPNSLIKFLFDYCK